MRYHNIALLLMLALLIGVAQEVRAQVGECTSPLSEAYLDVNNVRARILNNGNLFWRGDPFVYEVPKGGGANAIFTSGIWVGGLVGGQLRAAAARYGSYQFWSGPLDDTGAPPADCSEFDRIYKVSRTDILEYEATGATTPDLRDWPTGLGAPTLAAPDNGLDDDNDGEVDEEGEQIFLLDQPLAKRVDRVVDLAGGERPAILGDQSIWWIMNDRGNEHIFSWVASTPPIGLEVHVLAFAFNTSGGVGNSTFYKYDLFYKGNVPLTDAYIGLFSDPDLGNYQDDWVGSDTLRGMGFVWNSDNEDEGGDGYGTGPPAAGYDFFQGPIVPSLGDTAQISGVKVPDFKNLKMTHFVGGGGGSGTLDPVPDPIYGSDYYNYLSGRWKDGKRITLGGNGYNFSETPVNFMYPGNIGTGPASCEFWSECNADGAGTQIQAADRRFVMSSGPFVINPGDYQQIVFGIIWARGENSYDSVQKLKAADELAQTAFDINFQIPAPPHAPDVVATAMDGEVILEWSNTPQSNNFLESYVATDPFAPVDNNLYEFEGYTVYQFNNPLDQIGEIIATYDVPNGITRVVDGVPGEPTSVTARGSDSGLRTYHTVGGLTNYTTYYFGVQGYAYNDASTPKVYRGPITRVEVIPTRNPNVLQDAAIDAASDVAADFHATKEGIGDGSVTAAIVNPARVVDATYTVEFYELPTAETVEIPAFDDDEIDAMSKLPFRPSEILGVEAHHITYDIRRDGELIFDGSTTGQAAPQRPDVVALDGLLFSVLGPTPGWADFLTVANAAGPLDPPESASLSWGGFPDPEGLGAPTIGRQQSTSNSRWFLHAGGAANSSYGAFLARAMRGNNQAEAGIRDYEYRFTQRCFDGIDGVLALSDCLALRVFQDGRPMEVPFELWDAGISSPDDPSDDVRLLPLICDTGLCGGGLVDGVFDIGGDHVSSSASDDPFTDWVYWWRTTDPSPGEGGYNGFWTGETDPLVEVMARSVLVVHNGGTAPPYDPDMVEPGTVFRFTTKKPNQPGAVFTFSTAGYGAQSPDLATQQDRLDDIGIVPNPYSGASAYEVSQLTDNVRFTNLPDVATIRVYTLNGTLIKTLEKRSPGVATLSWNLNTDNNLPIASGVYLIHVNVPDVGSKVLKFAVVKKRIQLNTY